MTTTTTTRYPQNDYDDYKKIAVQAGARRLELADSLKCIERLQLEHAAAMLDAFKRRAEARAALEEAETARDLMERLFELHPGQIRDDELEGE